MSNEETDQVRVDQIIKVDTGTLLNTIRDLESKLSEYHRQDRVPPWAESLVARLDRIEQVLDSVNNTEKISGSLGGNAHSSLTLGDLSHEERLLVKVRAALDAQTNASRLSTESRMTAISFEMERLHKLLTIRPTTSEFQQIILSVNELQRKVYDSLEDISMKTSPIIQEKVTQEMSCIADQLRASEESAQAKNDLIMKKIESLSADILNLSGSDTENIEKALNRALEDVAAIRNEFLATKTQRETEVAGIQYALTEMRFSQDMTRNMLDEFKSAVSSSVNRLETTVRNSEETVNRAIRDVDERVQNTALKASEATSAVQELKGQYDFDMGKLGHSVKVTSESLGGLMSRLESMEAYIKPQQEMDLVSIVRKQDEALTLATTQMKDLDEKMDNLGSRMNKISKSITALQDDINSRVPEQISRQNDRIDRLVEEQRLFEESVRVMGSLIKQSQDSIGELSSLVTTVDALRRDLSAAEDGLNGARSSIATLMETTGAHENRLEAIADSVSKSEEGVARVIDEMRESLFDLIMEKQAEVDADVKNLRENLEIMSLVGGGNGGGSGAVGISSGFGGGGNAGGNGGGRGGGSGNVSTGGIGIGIGGASGGHANTGTNRDDGRQYQIASTANAIAGAIAGASTGAPYGGGLRRVASRGGSGKNALGSSRSMSTSNLARNYSGKDRSGALSGAGSSDLGLNELPDSAHGTDTRRLASPAGRNVQSASNPGAAEVVAANTVRANNAGVVAGGFESAGIGAFRYGLSVDDQRALMLHYAQMIATLCESYEDISVRKTSVPPLPTSMCEHMTSIAQVLAAFISTYVDAEMVQRAIRNRAYNALGDSADEGNATDMREAKIEEFVSHAASLMTSNHPETGIVRLEARDKFMKLTKKALLMCMSKHDQVLLLGSSRLGRVKIPTCIACDRPLIDKVRMDTTSYLNGQSGNNAPFSAPATGNFNDIFDTSNSATTSPIKDRRGKPYMPFTASAPTQAFGAFDSFDRSSGRTPLPDLYPQRGNRQSEQFLMLSDGRDVGNDSEGGFVLRGGFRMPRPTTST